MNPLLNWIQMHPTMTSLAGFWAFSAFVSGMPEPKPTSGVGYVWLYNSLHFVASNLNSVFAKKGVPMPAAPEAEPEMPHVVPAPEKEAKP